MSELLRQLDNLEKSRTQANRLLESSTGMSQARFRWLEKMLGQGMREGLVSFTPDASTPGSYGTLRVAIEENGDQVTRELMVSTDQDAAVLITLQQQALKPR